MKSEKVALGIIIKNLTKLSPIIDFLNNAKNHHHHISHLIIGYAENIDMNIIQELEKYCTVTTIKFGDSTFLENSLSQIGLDKKEIDLLLQVNCIKKNHTCGYGTSRNHVLIAAILLGMDYLLFFDSDIYPYILDYDKTSNEYIKKEIDFVGNHMKYLRDNDNVVVTTSDYTGYYIIPKMNFPHLHDLLFGIQKEEKTYYVSHNDQPVISDHKLQKIFDTDKILGGNLAINLSKLEILPPFFSTNLLLDNRCYLGRGEDTLFSPIIHTFGGKCLNIDMLIFHNCFGDFPNKPDIDKQKNIDRFFYATMGWAIRNPFFNWIKSEHFLKGEEINYEKRHKAIIKGSKAAALFFDDDRFLKLPRAFEKSYQKLPEDIQHYKKLITIWAKMKKLFMQEEK